MRLLDKRSYSIISLFSGGGFLDVGFMNNGFQIQAAHEIDLKFIQAYNFALSNYVSNSKNPYFSENIITHSLVNDSTDVSDIFVQYKIGKDYKGIEGVIGGPPCQDYSIGGKNIGIIGERGKLILSYYSIIEKVKPLFLLFENVEGLYRTKSHRENFLDLITNIEKLGYTVWYDIINPLNYGFPQDRPRIIVVAFLNQVVEHMQSKGFVLERNNDILKRNSDDRFIFRWPLIKFENPKIFQWPKKWEFGSTVFEEAKLIPEEFSSLLVKNAIENIQENFPNQNEVFNPFSKKFQEIQEGDTQRKSFKRIHRYRFSPTVAYGNNEVHLHPTLPRRLSVREALRIQTVPDEYILPKDITLTSKFKLISNGVPTAQADLIAKEIRRTLNLFYNN
ncbi:DNA cytosine methyltransferase [Paenibacillus sp. Z6-24]